MFKDVMFKMSVQNVKDVMFRMLCSKMLVKDVKDVVKDVKDVMFKDVQRCVQRYVCSKMNI